MFELRLSRDITSLEFFRLIVINLTAWVPYDVGASRNDRFSFNSAIDNRSKDGLFGGLDGLYLHIFDVMIDSSRCRRVGGKEFQEGGTIGLRSEDAHMRALESLLAPRQDIVSSLLNPHSILGKIGPWSIGLGLGAIEGED